MSILAEEKKTRKGVLFEHLFYIFAFITCTLAIFPLVFGENNIILFNYIFIYLISLVILINNLEKLSIYIKNNKILFVFLGLLSISIVWSVDILFSLQKVLGFIGVTLLGLAFSCRLSYKDLLKIIFFSYLIITTLSILFIVYLPDLGVHNDFYYLGDYRGVYTHKNTLGINMVFSTFITIHYLISINNKKLRLLALLNILLSIYLLLNSNSKTALVMVISIVLILILILLIRNFKDKYIVVSFTMFILIAITMFLVFAFKNYDNIIGILNRDPSMTGRTEIWKYGIEKLSERPLLGYGYYGFWQIPKYALSNHYNGHNGFLDIAIYSGIIGLTLFLLVLFTTFLRTYTIIFSKKGKIGLFFFTVFLLLLMYNIVETNYILTNDIKWALFIYIVINSKNYNQNKKTL
ncbi:O-antigen ligase [Anoxybacillus gonensis]|uniref:O-antigen ligase family protein n=1 Tax=Anoxybacillus gonensis TaxID=198467 RepID=UPI00214BE435|nr:O-antigen ligase family protein [Anoxybacillus gonensis]MCQ5363554.1 O-antigen ligase family protein [Anoxybacillus gonensis]